MGHFADLMNATVNSILDSRKDRNEAVDRVLDSARAFVKQADQDHQAMATQCRSDLKANMKSRSDYMNNFRKEIRANREEAHSALCAMLATTRSAREAHLGGLMTTFSDARASLAEDFQLAGQIWKRAMTGKKG